MIVVVKVEVVVNVTICLFPFCLGLGVGSPNVFREYSGVASCGRGGRNAT